MCFSATSRRCLVWPWCSCCCCALHGLVRRHQPVKTSQITAAAILNTHQCQVYIAHDATKLSGFCCYCCCFCFCVFKSLRTDRITTSWLCTLRARRRKHISDDRLPPPPPPCILLPVLVMSVQHAAVGTYWVKLGIVTIFPWTVIAFSHRLQVLLYLSPPQPQPLFHRTLLFFSVCITLSVSLSLCLSVSLYPPHPRHLSNGVLALFTPSIPISPILSVPVSLCPSVSASFCPLCLSVPVSLSPCLSVPLRFFLSPVSLCPRLSVPVSLCPRVSLSTCLSVPVSLCPRVSDHVSLCPRVSLSPRLSVPVSLCPRVSLFPRLSVPVSLLLPPPHPVSLSPCLSVPVSLLLPPPPQSICPRVSLSPRFSVPAFLCPRVSLSPCLSVPASLCPRVSVHVSLCPRVSLSSRLSVPVSLCPRVSLCGVCWYVEKQLFSPSLLSIPFGVVVNSPRRKLRVIAAKRQYSHLSHPSSHKDVSLAHIKMCPFTVTVISHKLCAAACGRSLWLSLKRYCPSVGVTASGLVLPCDGRWRVTPFLTLLPLRMYVSQAPIGSPDHTWRRMYFPVF